MRAPRRIAPPQATEDASTGGAWEVEATGIDPALGREGKERHEARCTPQHDACGSKLDRKRDLARRWNEDMLRMGAALHRVHLGRGGNEPLAELFVKERMTKPSTAAHVSAREQYELEHLARKYGMHVSLAKTVRADEHEMRKAGDGHAGQVTKTGT
jgi:hypothetical protein